MNFTDFLIVLNDNDAVQKSRRSIHDRPNFDRKVDLHAAIRRSFGEMSDLLRNSKRSVQVAWRLWLLKWLTNATKTLFIKTLTAKRLLETVLDEIRPKRTGARANAVLSIAN